MKLLFALQGPKHNLSEAE